MENLKLKDFLDYKFLSDLQISPDKKYAAFTVHTSDFDENKYLSNIYIYNCLTSEYKKLTTCNKEKSFIWINDDILLFPSIRDNKLKEKIDKGEQWTAFYAINIHGGEAYEYMRIPMNVSDIKLLSENKFIITAEYDHYGINLHSLSGDEKTKAIDLIKENKDYEILDEIPFWANGEGFTNKKRNRLYVFDKLTHDILPISDKFENVSLSGIKDNKALYITEKFTNKKEMTTGLYLYDLNLNDIFCIVEDGEYSIDYAEIIGNNIIFCGSLMDTYGLNQNYNFYKIDDGDIKLLAEHDFGMHSSVGTDCKYGGGIDVRVNNNELYFVGTENKSSFIKKLSLDGTITTLTRNNGTIDCFDIGTDEILFIGLRGQKLQEVYSFKPGFEIQKTKFNEAIYQNKYISVPERLDFISDDVKIEGYVLKPVNFDQSKTYPGILDIHGGPKTVYGEVFYHEMQYWANEGYFVFFCNPRGSDGRGNAFADIRGKYGTIDYDDLMKFTDKVLDKYHQIDPSRIGVTGGSYGGFMTNWIIGHTDRFKCAASQRSISNWISKFGTTDIGYFFNADQIQSTPWDNVEKLWYHSPLKYANLAVTPTLFIHSEEDYRCWLPEGLQMFTALKYHGVDARLCMFRGENHELSRSGKPKHRVRRLEELTNWFEKYLK
ncbi:MAG: family peptidase [Bacillota bacterium]|nr:family peptidase [Bacillota bacterium]